MLLEVQTFNFTLFKYKSDVKLISYYYKKYLLKFLLNINLRLCTGKGETFYGFKKKGKEVETKKDESKEVELTLSMVSPARFERATCGLKVAKQHKTLFHFVPSPQSQFKLDIPLYFTSLKHNT